MVAICRVRFCEIQQSDQRCYAACIKRYIQQCRQRNSQQWLHQKQKLVSSTLVSSCVHCAVVPEHDFLRLDRNPIFWHVSVCPTIRPKVILDLEYFLPFVLEKSQNPTNTVTNTAITTMTTLQQPRSKNAWIRKIYIIVQIKQCVFQHEIPGNLIGCRKFDIRGSKSNLMLLPRLAHQLDSFKSLISIDSLLYLLILLYSTGMSLKKSQTWCGL